MRDTYHLLRFCLLAAILTLGHGGQAAVASVTCYAYSGPDMAFGQINALAGGVVSSSASIDYGCNNGDQPVRVLLCFGADRDPQAPAGYNPRHAPLLYSSLTGYSLAYTLYADAARTMVLGSFNAGEAQPLAIVVTIPPYWGQGAATIYGDIKTVGQTALPNGNYGSNLPMRMSYMVYNEGVGADCSNPQLKSGSSWFSRIDASVTAQCHIKSASTLNFGTVYGLLSQNVDGMSTINVVCSNALAYYVGLDDGAHSMGGARRMRGADGYLQYELYSDPQRTQRWGNGGGMVSGVGTGNGQNLTVYGRLIPQALPGKGLFSDTIVVTVTY
jgi:spore coat protein U-like protein